MQITIQAFGRTAPEVSMGDINTTSAQLRETSQKLRRLGFRREADDYENRAKRVDAQTHRKKLDCFNRDYDKANAQRRKQVAPDFAKGVAINKARVNAVPHISRVKEKVVAAHDSKYKPCKDFSMLLPPSKIALLQKDRDAAWRFHQHAAIA